MQGIGAFLARTFLVLLSMLVGFALLEASARAYLRYSADELTFLRYASLRQLEDRFRAAGERASTSSETRYSPHR